MHGFIYLFLCTFTPIDWRTARFQMFPHFSSVSTENKINMNFVKCKSRQKNSSDFSSKKVFIEFFFWQRTFE